jgi:hypothetical protein
MYILRSCQVQIEVRSSGSQRRTSGHERNLFALSCGAQRPRFGDKTVHPVVRMTDMIEGNYLGRCAVALLAAVLLDADASTGLASLSLSKRPYH